MLEGNKPKEDEEIHFYHLENHVFKGFTSNKLNFIKWGLDKMYVKRFTYDRLLKNYQKNDEFLQCFFNSPDVNQHIKVGKPKKTRFLPINI